MNIVILTETPYKYPSLTGDMLFRLWKAAIKDDDTLANEVIRGIYDGMMAFDRERAEDAVDLTVRRHPTSRDAFYELSSRICKYLGAKQKSCSPAAIGPGLAASFEIRISHRRRLVFFKLPVWHYASDQTLAVSCLVAPGSIHFRMRYFFSVPFISKSRQESQGRATCRSICTRGPIRLNPGRLR